MWRSERDRYTQWDRPSSLIRLSGPPGVVTCASHSVASSIRGSNRPKSPRRTVQKPSSVTVLQSSPLSITSLGDVGGGGGVTDRATRGACSAGSGWAEQYLTSSMGEPQTPSPQPVTPRLVWVRTTAGIEASCFHLRVTAPHHFFIRDLFIQIPVLPLRMCPFLSVLARQRTFLACGCSSI